MTEGILLEIGEDGVAHLHEPKPILEIEFSSEDELIAWLSDVAKKGILPDVRVSFENIEDEDVLLGKLNSMMEGDSPDE